MGLFAGVSLISIIEAVFWMYKVTYVCNSWKKYISALISHRPFSTS